jgi:hypothetical protein
MAKTKGGQVSAISSKAKEIRKPNEKWTEAIKRASKLLKKEKSI